MLDFTAVYTTLSKTTLADIAVNSMVNLERALTPSTRMGGHFVLGHVDGCGRVVRDTPAGNSVLRTIWIPAPLRILAAPGGSVAIDGVSLTIAQSDMETITVSLIPYTLSGTTLGFMKPGCQVNVECDVLARYLHHMQKFGAADLKPETGAAQSEDFLTKLQKAGF
jgi:riboflavin synthase